MNFIGIDGLIRIAETCGLLGISTTIGAGADGLTAVCTLHMAGADKQTRVSMGDVAESVRRTSPMWERYPEQMLKSFVIRKAIEENFADAITTFRQGGLVT